MTTLSCYIENSTKIIKLVIQFLCQDLNKTVFFFFVDFQKKVCPTPRCDAGGRFFGSLRRIFSWGPKKNFCVNLMVIFKYDTQ